MDRSRYHNDIKTILLHLFNKKKILYHFDIVKTIMNLMSKRSINLYLYCKFINIILLIKLYSRKIIIIFYPQINFRIIDKVNFLYVVNYWYREDSSPANVLACLNAKKRTFQYVVNSVNIVKPINCNKDIIFIIIAFVFEDPFYNRITFTTVFLVYCYDVTNMKMYFGKDAIAFFHSVCRQFIPAHLRIYKSWLLSNVHKWKKQLRFEIWQIFHDIFTILTGQAPL